MTPGLPLGGGSGARLRAFGQFLAAAVVTIVVLGFLAPLAAVALHPHSANAFEALHRPLLVIFLLGAYIGLAKIWDRKAEAVAGMGLGVDRPWAKEWGTGAVIGGGAVIVCVAAIAILGSYAAAVERSPTAWLLLLVEAWILLAGALAEELAFRGYAFQRLVDAVGPVAAVALLSAMFGALHLGNPHVDWLALANTIFIGVLLSILYLRGRSLWLVWGVHFGWNFMLGVGFGLPVSGLKQFSVLVHGEATGPKWLTGGAYGIEASLTAALVVLAVIAGVTIYSSSGRIQVRED